MKRDDQEFNLRVQKEVERRLTEELSRRNSNALAEGTRELQEALRDVRRQCASAVNQLNQELAEKSAELSIAQAELDKLRRQERSISMQCM